MKNQLLKIIRRRQGYGVTGIMESRLCRDGCLNRFLGCARNDRVSNWNDIVGVRNDTPAVRCDFPGVFFVLVTLLTIGGAVLGAVEPNRLADGATEAIFAPATGIETPNYRLLPLKTDLIDANPLPLYLNVFADGDPNFPELEPDFGLIDAQLGKAGKEMDLAAVEKELEKCKEKLELLQRGSLCQYVEWPTIEQQFRWRHDDRMMMFAVFPSDEKSDYERPVFSPTEYLDFMLDMQRYGKLIALKARYHVVQGNYDQGAVWIRVGLCVSRQMVTDSNLQLGMAAASNASLILQQIELWVQTPGSPSLYRSLGDLPQPFLHRRTPASLFQNEPKHQLNRDGYYMDHWGERLEENEARDVLPDFTGEQFSHATGQIDRFVAILECLEALRYYAAIYDGDLPRRLVEITELRVPVDPVTRRPFAYSKGSEGITLKAPDWDSDDSRCGFEYVLRFED